MKKLWLILACFAALTVLGCKKKENAPAAQAEGQQAGGKYLRFAWWGNTVRDERTNKVAQLFQTKNPGVTVETEPTAWDGYWQKINTQAAGKSLPDVMQQDYAYIVQYNNRGLLLDLTPYTTNGTIDLSQWADSAVSAGKLGDKLIALNLGINAWGMGVDPAVLEKAGITFDDTQWTWKDFENIALTIYQKTGVKTMPFDQYMQVMEFLVREYGYTMYSADQKSLGWSDNPQIIADWLDIDLRLKAAGALYDPEEAFITVTMEEYQLSTGKTWNAYYWSNQHIAWQNAAKRPINYVMNPTIGPQRKKFGTFLKPSQFISVLSTSENKDLAAKFVNFFVNDKEANDILLAERGIPAPQDVRDYLAPKVDPAMKVLFDYITHVTPYSSPIDPPDPAAAGEVRDAFKPIILQCLTGKISSLDAAKQMIAAGNAILSR